MPDGPSPFDAIRARFLLRLTEQRDVLERLSAVGDNHGEARDIAHKIAGIAGSLGYPALSAAASDVEMLLVGESSVTLHGTAQFRRLMEQIEADLEKR